MNHPRQGIKDIPYICSQLGVKFIVITPGSRNAPLIFSFNQEKSITCLSITDERSAGYFALGIAQASGKPVGLLCTSGTAALNFGPAIAEAFFQNLPLIVFTADRPPELIDQADGQTIRQTELFKNHVKQSFNLPVETSADADLWFSNRIISQAIGTATGNPSGPVQINVPLREPLYDKLPAASSNPQIIKNTSCEPVISETESAKLFSRWNKFEKKMVIVGFNSPDDKFSVLLKKLSEDKSVIIVAENLSNLSHDSYISSPEQFFAALKEDEKMNFMPELLVTFGNSVVSKRLKQYVRKYKPAEHWNIAPQTNYTDTFQSLSLGIELHPEKFIEKILSGNSNLNSKRIYAELFYAKVKEIWKKHEDYLQLAPFSDLKAFEQILKSIPSGTNLHLSNSTPVRYAQLFKTRKDLNYFSNRGTSGIDGCISTAAGSAFYSKKPTVIITGDLAFIYDSNAMWNNYLSEDFKIIVMNNGGGNIFTLIETSPEIESLMNYFETPHKVNLSQLSAAFGLKHYVSDNPSSLKENLKKMLETPGPSVLEIITDAATDTMVFKQYFSQLKN